MDIYLLPYDRLHRLMANQKNAYLFVITLTLHYLCKLERKEP